MLNKDQPQTKMQREKSKVKKKEQNIQEMQEPIFKKLRTGITRESRVEKYLKHYWLRTFKK